MSRLLRFLGLAVLAGVAWALLADTAGWIPAGSVDGWFGPLAAGGGALFAIGVVGAVLSPLGRKIRRGHCQRCNSAIERGQTYCADHLQETVNEARDHLRQGSTAPRRGPA